MLVQLYIPASFFVLLLFKYHKNVRKLILIVLNACLNPPQKKQPPHTLDALIAVCFYEFRGVRR